MNELIQTISGYIDQFNGGIGFYLLLGSLVPAGVFLTLKFRFLQVRSFTHALKVVRGDFDDPNDPGDISHFKALSTALSGTIGVGNITGVALAIFTGGPGAVFWMWVTAFFGMMTKCAECTLGLKYRKTLSSGFASGGPMYYLERAFGKISPKLGRIAGIYFAVGFIAITIALGNLIQSNSLAQSMSLTYSIPTWITGLVLASVLFMVIVGGIKRISDVTSFLVPIMTLIYICAALVILVINITEIPAVFLLIVKSAFSIESAAGGFLGSAFIVALRSGVARGAFSNEAGLGSAPVAHAAAKTKYPVREGIVASLGPFIDTIVICSMTALIILSTGVWKNKTEASGSDLTIQAFDQGLSALGMSGMGAHIVTLGLILFAFSTALAWAYYGEQAVVYLFKEKAITPYRILYCICVFFGSLFAVKFVWSLGDLCLALTTLPNLLGVVILSNELKSDIKEYFSKYST
ncbi:MAG: sodium:alanine symporter family protein [Bdellovibrionales bacterium]|nr:sodium:alanine symporter family protein [Bdellovibrionales bacterium]